MRAYIAVREVLSDKQTDESNEHYASNPVANEQDQGQGHCTSYHDYRPSAPGPMAAFALEPLDEVRIVRVKPELNILESSLLGVCKHGYLPSCGAAGRQPV